MALARKLPLQVSVSKGPRRLWNELRGYLGDHESCWPSQARLAIELYASLRTIERWMSQLTRVGLLDKQCTRFAGASRNTYRLFDSPRLNFDNQDSREEALALVENLIKTAVVENLPTRQNGGLAPDKMAVSSLSISNEVKTLVPEADCTWVEEEEPTEAQMQDQDQAPCSGADIPAFASGPVERTLLAFPCLIGHLDQQEAVAAIHYACERLGLTAIETAAILARKGKEILHYPDSWPRSPNWFHAMMHRYLTNEPDYFSPASRRLKHDGIEAETGTLPASGHRSGRSGLASTGECDLLRQWAKPAGSEPGDERCQKTA